MKMVCKKCNKEIIKAAEWLEEQIWKNSDGYSDQTCVQVKMHTNDLIKLVNKAFNTKGGKDERN